MRLIWPLPAELTGTITQRFHGLGDGKECRRLLDEEDCMRDFEISTTTSALAQNWVIMIRHGSAGASAR